MRWQALVVLVALAGCCGEPGVPEPLVAEARKQVDVDWGPKVSLSLADTGFAKVLSDIAAKGGPTLEPPIPPSKGRLSGALYDVPGLIALDIACLQNGCIACVEEGQLVAYSFDDELDLEKSIAAVEKLAPTRRGRALHAALHALWNLRSLEGVTASDIDKWTHEGK
jgi:hypothetical protein